MYPFVIAATDYPSRPDNETSWHNISDFREKLALHLRPFKVVANIKVDSDVVPIASRTLSKGYLWPRVSGACFWPTHRGQKPRIEIVLHHMPRKKRFAITTTRREQLRFRILNILSHELVHRYQMMHRNVIKTDSNPSRILLGPPQAEISADRKKDQLYLADYDEIEAYAHDAVQELWYYGKIQGIDVSGQKLVKAAKAVFFEQDETAPMIYPLWLYHQTFGGDSSHPAIQALFRKMQAWEKVGQPIDVS